MARPNLNQFAPTETDDTSNQNYVVSPGALGQQPAPGGQALQMPLDVTGRLSTPEEFSNIIVRSAPGGVTSQSGTGSIAQFPWREERSVSHSGFRSMIIVPLA